MRRYSPVTNQIIEAVSFKCPRMCLFEVSPFRDENLVSPNWHVDEFEPISITDLQLNGEAANHGWRGLVVNQLQKHDDSDRRKSFSVLGIISKPAERRDERFLNLNCRQLNLDGIRLGKGEGYYRGRDCLSSFFGALNDISVIGEKRSDAQQYIGSYSPYSRQPSIPIAAFLFRGNSDGGKNTGKSEQHNGDKETHAPCLPRAAIVMGALYCVGFGVGLGFIFAAVLRGVRRNRGR